MHIYLVDHVHLSLMGEWGKKSELYTILLVPCIPFGSIHSSLY